MREQGATALGDVMRGHESGGQNPGIATNAKCERSQCRGASTINGAVRAAMPR
jgi:hypothetical protein